MLVEVAKYEGYCTVLDWEDDCVAPVIRGPYGDMLARVGRAGEVVQRSSCGFEGVRGRRWLSVDM